MKKTILKFGLFLLAVLLPMGCSNEEEDERAVLIDYTFQLSTIEGNITKVFRYGDNIVFDLQIINYSDYDITYGSVDADILLGEDLFYVYSKDGNGIGLPWTGMYCEYTGQRSFVIPSHSIKRVCCTWKLCKEISASHPLCKSEDNTTLPIGDYYTRFSIIYNKNMGSTKKMMTEKIIQTDFKIQ